MRHNLYLSLMEHLDSVLLSGYDEVLEQDPQDIVDAIYEQNGIAFDKEVGDDEELYRAIRNWQERHQ